MKINSAIELKNYSEELQSSYNSDKTCISIAGGTCGFASGAEQLIKIFKDEIDRRDLGDKIDLRVTGCRGFCSQEPIVVIYPRELFYRQVKPKDVEEIIEKTILQDIIVERLLFVDAITGQKVIEESKVPYYKYQKRLLLSKNGEIDPTKIDDYILKCGYQALPKALNLKPEEVIDEINNAGLRGRGGAGFPTGRKWSICRASLSNLDNDSIAYIICNADEGDPGAFMDRSLVEGNPHGLIEGMIIGAYAISGSLNCKSIGIVYLRNEYPLAYKHLKIALEQAREYGLLGDNILGTDFSFDITINRGAGAFVCGEETAMIASIESKIGQPRPRPPYPVESGLYNQPTNINNVKTWANVPVIINYGAEWYSKIGTETSKGTMIFSLVGKIENTGLIEVPMGITLREIIYKIGGGLPDQKFRAQIGGPSGGLIPEHMLDQVIDYESLSEVGSMMGSGGLIVADMKTCMVNIAKYFLSFTQEESCGRCTPCREGTKYLLKLLTKICDGEAQDEDLTLLEETAQLVKETSLCGLGKTAPNPILTTLRYFRAEYIEHIVEKKCRGGECKALISYSILEEYCTGCNLCLKECPSGAITGELKKVHTIDLIKCSKCGICSEVCKFEAIQIQ